MAEIENKDGKDRWAFLHKNPIGQNLIVAVTMFFLGAAYNEWKTSSEARLVMSTMGYRVEAPLVFPLLGFKVGETGAGYYCMLITNDGSKPLHHVRVGLDNMGKVHSIAASGRWTIRSLTGEQIEDLNALSGQTSLGFTIDSLAPKGSMLIWLTCYTNSVTGEPYPTLSSEETMGKVSINDASLENFLLLQMGSRTAEFKENYRNLRKWEKAK